MKLSCVDDLRSQVNKIGMELHAQVIKIFPLTILLCQDQKVGNELLKSKTAMDETKAMCRQMENMCMEIRKELGTFNSKQAKMRSEIKDFENLMDEFRQNNEQ